MRPGPVAREVKKQKEPNAGAWFTFSSSFSPGLQPMMPLRFSVSLLRNSLTEKHSLLSGCFQIRQASIQDGVYVGDEVRRSPGCSDGCSPGARAARDQLVPRSGSEAPARQRSLGERLHIPGAHTAGTRHPQALSTEQHPHN